MSTLSSQAIQNELKSLPEWEVVNGSVLTKSVPTRDFAESLALANAVGRAAEEAEHHPDLTVSWGRLTITLTTHDESGVTLKDIALAREIERLLEHVS